MGPGSEQVWRMSRLSNGVITECPVWGLSREALALISYHWALTCCAAVCTCIDACIGACMTSPLQCDLHLCIETYHW